jgi:hypothetical protein
MSIGLTNASVHAMMTVGSLEDWTHLGAGLREQPFNRPSRVFGFSILAQRIDLPGT